MWENSGPLLKEHRTKIGTELEAKVQEGFTLEFYFSGHKAI